jgi:hypothetical protein
MKKRFSSKLLCRLARSLTRTNDKGKQSYLLFKGAVKSYFKKIITELPEISKIGLH